MKYSIFSFFSGAGFLDLGFEHAGFEIAFVNEIRRSFLSSYQYSRSNLGLPIPKYGYSSDSVEDFLSGEHNKFLVDSLEKEIKNGRIVGFIGGPPCPDFSVAGKNRGREGDHGRLSGIYSRLITSSLPHFFVFENVKGLWRTKRHRGFYEELKSEWISAGYLITECLMNSIEFGVPQDRERILVFGIRSEFSGDDRSLDGFNWKSKALFRQDDVFGAGWPETDEFGGSGSSNPSEFDVLTVAHWFRRNDVEHHPNSRDRFRPKAGLEKFLKIREGDDSKKSYKRLHRFRYSPTVAYGNNEVHLHPTEPRRLSVAEALALQSLPAEFILPGNMTLSDKFKVIGNGVPYLLAKGIAETIKEFLDKTTTDYEDRCL